MYKERNFGVNKLSLKSSSGLVIELGSNLSETTIQKLYNYLWALPEFDGPATTMYEFMGVPRAAEGQLNLEHISGACYTKFEKDALGYPSEDLQPTILTISTYKFDSQTDKLDQILFDYHLSLAQKIYSIFPFKIAVIGDVTIHYVNSKLLHESWFDYYAKDIQAVIIEENHPLKNVVPATILPESFGLYYYDKAAIMAFHTNLSIKEKIENLNQWAKSQFEKITI